MKLGFFKKGTFLSIGIGILLFIVVTIFYVKGIVILPIIPDPYNYFTLLITIISLSVGAFKFFYVIELKNKHNEVNRIKSYYFINLKKEKFAEIISLSDDEIIERYNSEPEMDSIEQKLDKVKLPSRD